MACGSLLLAGSGPAANDRPQTIRNSADSQEFWVEEVVTGLKYPSTMVWLPAGEMLVIEREGGLRVVRESKLDSKPLDGIPSSFQNALNGLKDIALDPDYASNRLLYLLISEGTYDAHHAAVYRARYESSGLKAVQRIFRSKDSIGGVGEIASRMLFLPDKTLLVAVPENNYHKPLAQRLDSHVGKILRINRDGSVPGDNPYLNNADALPEIWSYGHRGPTGLYRDPASGLVWEVEPGPDGGDELNILKAGANFGWATWTWGFEYGGGLAGPYQRGAGVEGPIHVWMSVPHPKTPSGITRYSGDIYPSFKGDFFVGHLTGTSLQRLRIDNGEVVLEQRLLSDLQERIREVKEGPDHYLYLLTDNPNGRVLRLHPGAPARHQFGRVARKLERKLLWTEFSAYADVESGDPEKGRQAFIERCSGCHRVGAVVRGASIGPDLGGVVGRFAGTGEFSYSRAMAKSSQQWNLVSLDLFVADPAGYLPGTSMAAPPLADREVRRHIVAFLEKHATH